MSKITDWINSELYPSLFEVIDTALPEFDFKRRGRNWISSNKLKITGEEGDSIGKVYIWENAPGRLKDFTRGTSSMVDYIIERDKVEFIQAVKTLANVAGLQLPDNGNFNPEALRKHQEGVNILEEANSYFIKCLENATEEDEVRAYLQGRGYSVEDINTMELGYIPSQGALYKHLEKQGYTKEQTGEALRLHKDIGDSNKLTIPYRSGGQLKGFVVRATGPAERKYIVSTGLTRGEQFFNITALKGDKDLVIVEGYLDALHATAKGMDNVVGLGSADVTVNQVKDAIKRGAKSFTLCLDTDKAGETGTLKAIEVILAEGVNRIYIVTLPDLGGGKTDPDSLIKDKGIDAFKEAISEARSYFNYLLQNILTPYERILEDKEGLTDKEVASLQDEVVALSVSIPNPIDRDLYKRTALVTLQGLGVTEESLAITMDKLTSTKDKEAKATAFNKLLTKATELQAKGDTDKALELLDAQVKEVRLKDKGAIFSKLQETITREDIVNHFSKHSDSLRSGVTINNNELLLPSGGLTGIAGATGHGKTDFLVNLCLNAVINYPDKEFYFFTYEMSQEAILVRFLNSYLDMDLEAYSNQRAIKTYFKTGSTQYIKTEVRADFLDKVNKFFTEIIATGRLRVKGVDFLSMELNLALIELNKGGRVGGYFVDYFQLIRTGNHKGSRQEELKVICLDLNETAKRIQLPIVLGAQFNREVTTPFRLHPTNISEAGDIERILDTLIGIWFTNKKMVSKDLTKAEEKIVEDMGLNLPDRLYTYILKSRETPTDTSDLLVYSGKKGVIRNSNNSGIQFK